MTNKDWKATDFNVEHASKRFTVHGFLYRIFSQFTSHEVTETVLVYSVWK